MTMRSIAALVFGGSLCLPLAAYAAPAAPPSVEVSTANAALQYWMAMALLREVPLDAEGRALLERAANGQAPWNEAVLAATVAANHDAIETLRRGVALPGCDWQLDWSLGPQTPVAHLPKARVLGRLVALAGSQAAAHGRFAEATDLWLAGITFSNHLARDGSLISALTARAVLGANLRSVTQAAGTTRIDAAQVQRIVRAVNDLPRGAFDWGTAIDREGASVEVMIRQLGASDDRTASYRRITGTDAPAAFVMPTAAQVRQFQTLMHDIAAAMRLPPDRSRDALSRLASRHDALPAILHGAIPSLERVNAARVEIENERRALLSALARQH
jgi:hypothetical protein